MFIKFRTLALNYKIGRKNKPLLILRITKDIKDKSMDQELIMLLEYKQYHQRYIPFCNVND